MAFQFDEKTISAFDSEKNIRIRRSGTFYDISDEFFFIYAGPDLKFEFSVAVRKEPRRVMIRGRLTEKMMTVANIIIEPSLKSGLAKATHGRTLDTCAYETIKSDVAAGMFVLSTWGGSLLSFVPDYRIEFSPQRPKVG